MAVSLAKGQHHNFGQVQNAFVRVVNVMAELYRKDGAWRLNAVGGGYEGGLQALLARYS